ncbi:MAG TPA: hypothetical protein VFR97_14180 [Capillimicrobium sp.]|nr:hypothetical protein [Capillimicrobium sp.]
MPYLVCSDCHVTTYSAALFSGTDECPKCGCALPVRRHERSVTEWSRRPVALGDDTGLASSGAAPPV